MNDKKPRKKGRQKILVHGLDCGSDWSGLNLNFRAFTLVWAGWTYFGMDWTGWTNFYGNLNAAGWTEEFWEWIGLDGLLQSLMGLISSAALDGGAQEFLWLVGGYPFRPVPNLLTMSQQTYLLEQIFNMHLLVPIGFWPFLFLLTQPVRFKSVHKEAITSISRYVSRGLSWHHR